MNAPTISVIIPVWNHADEAVECLESLKRQTFKDFEVIMVDDGSTDGLAERVFDKPYPFAFDLIRFLENFGAPRARNEGFHRSEGRYVIFLDADITLRPDALEKMLAALEAHPDAAFAYSSFYFGWKLFKSRPFDAQLLRERPYIHTSALIRREAFPKFDESLKKFQDWDLWLTIVEQGGKGFWINQPLFKLKPRRAGMSQWLPKFVYDIPWDVFGFSPARVQRYQEAERIVLRKHGLLTDEMLRERLTFKRCAFAWFGVILAVEIISGAVIFHPLANAAVCALAGLTVFALTLKRPSWALAALSVELLIGSKGALFKIGGDVSNNGGISLRIVMFAAFLVGWIILTFLRKLEPRRWRELIKGREVYLVLGVVLVYGLARGWAMGNGATLLADANAWATWLLFFPVLDVVSRERRAVTRDLPPALVAGLFWLPIKTLLLFYFFGHGFLSVATGVYLWVRRTGVGEITLVGLNAFRIFFQSHIYEALLAVVLFAWMAARESLPRWMRALLVLTLAALFVSLSRSFWIGAAAGMSVVLVQRLRQHHEWPKFALKRFSLALAAAAVLVGVILALPIPPVNTSSLLSLLEMRANLGENAAVSRWTLFKVLEQKIAQHPILGSGFGATVTYQSKDPRIVAQTGGLYTTYAFEWGWLEHWVKFGIIGIPLMLWILWSLGRRTWRSSQPEWQRLAVVSSLVTLGVIHIFTPYLNHPLGFFVLFLCEALLVVSTPIVAA